MFHFRNRLACSSCLTATLATISAGLTTVAEARDPWKNLRNDGNQAKKPQAARISRPATASSLKTVEASYGVSQQDMDHNLGVLLDQSYGAATAGARKFVPGIDGFAGGKKWRPHVEFTAAPGSRSMGQVNLFAPLVQNSDSMLFADLRASAWTDDVQEGNFGIGYRQIVPGGFFGTDAIFGVYGFVDARNSAYDNMFYQGTFGAELITEHLEFRANAYLPSSTQYVVGATGGGIALDGFNIVTSGTNLVERALPGFDVEAGVKIDFSEAAIRLNAGYFRFERGDTLVEGPRFRAEVEIDDPFGLDGAKLSFGGEIRTDKVRGTEASGIVRLRMPIGGVSNSVQAERQLSGLDRLMTRRVYRDDDIVTPVVQGGSTQTLAPVTDAVSGESLQAFFVANAAQGAADCSSVANACQFVTAQGLAGAGDTFVPVDATGPIGSVFTLNNDRQRVIGAGDAGSATLVLPDSASSVLIITSLGGRPIVTGINIGHFADTRVAGLTTNSATGVTGNGFTGSATINDLRTIDGGLNFSNSAAAISVTDSLLSTGANPGVVLTNLTGNASFNNVDVASAGGTSLRIDGGSLSATFDSNSSMAQSGAGATVEVLNAHSGSLTSDAALSASSGTGLQFNNADGTYNFNGPSNLNGGDAGIDILGGSTGTFSFGADTAIVSPTGMAFTLTDSAATVNYNGTITQNNDATAISLANNTGGSVTFAGELTANTSTSAAVDLAGNTGATVSFTGGLDIDTTTGTGFSATGGGTISVAATGGNESITSSAGQALNLNGVILGAGGVSFDSISSTGSAGAGIAIDGVSGGGFGVSGATMISGSAGNAIQLTGNSAALNFNGATAITMTSAAIGVDFSGTTTGAVSFANLDIALQSANATGIDLSGAVINANVTATDFDLTSTSATGTTGVDLSGTTGTGTIRLGDSDVGGQSASIAGVGIGVQFSAGSNASFIFGDGEGATDKLSSISATTAISGGSTVTLGSYDFDDVNFTGTLDFAAGAGDDLVFVAATATGDFSGSDVNNRASVTTADAIATTGTTFVLINDGAAIDDIDGFTLVDGQTMASFGNGRTFASGGLVIPGNFSGVPTGGATITDPTGNGAAILTRTGGAGETLMASGTVNLQDFILENAAAGAGLTATGATTIMSTGLTVQNVAGQGINLNSLTGAASSFDNTSVSTTTGNAIDIVNSTVSFTGGLDIDTTSGTGFSATGGGTISVAATAGDESITTVTGQVLNLSGVSIGAGGVSFDGLTSTGTVPNDAILLSNVDGAGNMFSGGMVAIAGTSGGSTSGIEISGGSDATFHFASATIDGAGLDAIELTGANGPVTFDTVDIDGPAGYGLLIFGATQNVTIGGGSIGATVRIEDQAASSTIALTNLGITNSVADALHIFNAAGTILVTGGTITQSGVHDAVDITDSSATITIGANLVHTGTGDAVEIDATSGTISFTGTVTNSGGGYSVNIGSSGAVTAGTIGFSGNIGDTGSLGVRIQNLNAGAAVNVTGATTLTGSTGNGIELSNASGALSFAGVTIASPVGNGIDISGATGALSFGATTISGVGAAANQIGIDFSGATLAGTVAFQSVAISGPDTSTDSIGVDLTGVLGDQIVNLGSQTDPTTGPSSSITDLHRGVVIDNTAAVQFTFGDGESGADTGSSINVNAQAGAFTVDAGGGTLAASSFDFNDVAFGAGDAANFPIGAAPVFVSLTGGLVTAGTNNLSQDLTTISVADAEAQADTDQTFVFVGGAGGTLDLQAGGVDGFTLDAGQNLDGFNDGNAISLGILKPANVEGMFNIAGVTSDNVTALNTAGGATSVIAADAGGNHTIANFDISTGVTGVLINAATAAVTLSNVGVTGIAGAGIGVSIQGAQAAIALNNVDISGTATGIDNQLGAAAGDITVDAASSIANTTTIAVNLAQNASDFAFAGTISETDGTGAGIAVNQLGGAATFSGMVALDTGASNAVALTANTGSVSFSGGLDIDTTTGTGFTATGGGTIGATGTSTINVTGAATNAVNLTGVAIEAGGVTFASINASGTITGAALVFDAVTGGAFNGGDVTVAGTAGLSNGLSIDGSSASFGFGTVSLSNVAGHGLSLTGANGTVTVESLTLVNPGNRGIQILDATSNVTINGGSYSSTVAFSGFPVTIQNQSAGSTIAFTNFGITANNSSDYLNIQNSAGTITFAGGVFSGTSGNDGVDISGGTATISIGAAINHTGTSSAFSNAVEIDGVTGGSIAFTGAITHAGVGNAVDIGTDLANSGLTVTFGGAITQSIAHEAVVISGNTGGAYVFNGLVTANTSTATGINLTGNTGASIAFNGGLNIDTTTGIGFNATGGGTISVAATGGDESIVATSGQALNLDGVTIGAGGVTFDAISSTGSATTGIGLNGLTGGAFTVTGITTVSGAAANGIQLTGNTSAIQFGVTNVTMGAGAASAGIDFAGIGAGTISFGATTITNVGAAAGQKGIDFSGATLGGTFSFESVAISGPDTSTDSIGVDLTGVLGDQIVNLGSQTDPTTGPSSSITDLHRGVVIDNTATVQFTFGDGESGADTGSSINVNGQAGAYTVDAGGGTLAASSFDFNDVAFGAGDRVNLPATAGSAIFVSETGGLITVGTHGLSQTVDTITVAQAEALADSNQTFAFVAHSGAGTIDLAAGGLDGFTLKAGQSLDGFDDGAAINFGLSQPANIEADFGVLGGAVTQNSVVAGNTAGGATSIVATAAGGGGSTIQNTVFDATGLGAGDAVIRIDGAGAASPVTINNVEISNVGAGATAVALNNNISTVALTDVDLFGTNAGTALSIDSGAASTAAVTVDAASDINGTTGTVVAIGGGARDVTISTAIITANNTVNVIDIDGQTGGTIGFAAITSQGATGDSVIEVTGQTGGALSFGAVDIGSTTGFNNAAGTAVSLAGTGGSVSFAGLSINATAGAGLVADGPTLGVAGSTNSLVTSGATALGLSNLSVGAGGISFATIAAASGGANDGIDIDTVTTSGGNGIAIGSADLDGHTGVAIDLNAITGTGGFALISADIDLGAGGTGLGISGTNAGATFSIGNGVSNSVTGLSIDGGVTGTGIDLSGASGTIEIASADSADSVLNIGSSSAPTNAIVAIGFQGTANFGNATTQSQIAASATAVTFNTSTSSSTISLENATLASSGGNGVTISASDAGASITVSDVSISASNLALYVLNNDNAVSLTNIDINQAAFGVFGSDNNATGSLTITGLTVDNTTDDAVQLLNIVASLTNVTVGADVAVAGDAVQYNHTTNAAHSLTISGLTIGSDGDTNDVGGRGIFINQSAGSGTVTVSLSGTNEIHTTGAAIETQTAATANILRLGVSGTTTVESGSAGATIAINGDSISATENSTVVTGFSGVTVIGNGAGGGVLFDNVTFDADTAAIGTTAASSDQVAFGPLQIGQSTSARVLGNGLTFNNAIGAVDISTLNIFNTGGTGLSVDTKGAGTDFELTGGGSGTIDTTTGTALFLDPLATDLTFGTVSSTNSGTTGVTFDAVTGVGAGGTPNAVTIATLNISGATGAGVLVDSSSGSFSLGNVTITGGSGIGIDITGGSAAVTFGAGSSLTQTANAAAVSVSGGHTGSLTYSGGINATNGTGLQFNNADGSQYNFNGAVTLNGGDAGIDIVNGSSASFTFSNTNITSPTGTAFNIDSSTIASLTFGGSITQNNAAAAFVSNASTGGVHAISAAISASTGAADAVTIASTGTFNFTGDLGLTTTSGDGFTASGGAMITVTGANTSINTATGQILGWNGVTIGAGGVSFDTLAASGTVADHAVSLNDVDGAGAFSGGDVTIAGTSGGGNIGIRISGGSAATFTFDSATIDNTAGDGILLSGSNGAVTFTTVDIDGTGGVGIQTATNTNAVNINGGSIGATDDPAGRGVYVNGGSGNVTIAASITKTTGGNIVNVTSRTGGTVEFSGALNASGGFANGISATFNSAGTTIFSGSAKTISTGVNNAIVLSNNTGATVDFTGGGLDIDTTTGTAFSATGGGTVNVTGAGNTINATTGQILGWDGVSIGAAGVSFDTLAASGTTTNHSVNLNNVDGAGNIFSGGTVTIAGSAGAGIQISGNSDATFNFASATINNASAPFGAIALTGANGAVTFTTVDISGSGQYGVAISSNTNAININGGTIDTSTDAAVRVNTGSGNVTIAAAITNTSGAFIDIAGRTAGTVAFSGNVTGTGGTGISLTGNTGGAIQFTGTTTLTNVTGTAITIGTSGGSTVSFGATAISNPGATGIAIGVTGGTTFGNVDITNLANNTRGVDLRTASGAVTFATLDISSAAPTTGTRGIDLTGATNASNMTTTNPSTINNLAIGADLTNGAITGTFQYGDGAAPTASLIGNTTTAIVVTGLTASGTYNFFDVAFTGSGTGNLSGSSSGDVFWVSAAGAGDGSSAASAGSIADAQTAAGIGYIVLLDNAGAGQDTIDLGATTLTLDSDQQLLSFRDTDSFNFGGGPPANLNLTGITGGVTITNPNTGSGAPLLTSSALHTVNLAAGSVLDGLEIGNTYAAPFNALSGVVLGQDINGTVIIRNSTIEQTGAANASRGVVFNQTAASSAATVFTIADSIIRADRDGISINTVSTSGTPASYTATISGNTIANPGTNTFASGAGIGLLTSGAGLTTSRNLTISNNTISVSTFDASISIETTGSGSTSVHIDNNVITNATGFPIAGIFLRQYGNAGTTFCADIANNTMTLTGPLADVYVEVDNNSILNFENFAGPAGDAAAIQAYLRARGNGAGMTYDQFIISGTIPVFAGSCP